ncbi:MFS transporter, partial [Pediococcus pentosaceus]
TLGFGMLLYGVSEVSNKGWSNITTLAEIVVGLLLIIGWSWRQLVIDDPMIELRIFTVKNFTIASIISAIAQISMVAVEFILPLYLQNVRDLSAMNSGLSLLPGAIAMFLLAPISGSMVEKNKGRQAIMFGITIMSVSTLMLSFISLT